MAKKAIAIGIVDPNGDTLARCREALLAEGWTVKAAKSSADAKGRVDAVIVAGNLAAVEELRRQSTWQSAPVVLVASLDRSGWDRAFGDETAFSVDALLDMPVDVPALVKRIGGILAARQAAAPSKRPASFREVIRRAIAEEEAAHSFYNKAAAASRVPQTRAVLEGLAVDELEHKHILLDFLAGKTALAFPAAAPSSLVETLGTPQLTPDMSPADAFLLAARKEKLAADFYDNWANLYPTGPQRELLLKLAGMERRHKQHVEAMFANASFPEDFFE